ncbi:hypothetical protein LCGC14_2800130, partial [marine sediment metagenome]
EFKGKDIFDFRNYAKLIMATNSLPPTGDKTEGFYRRWKIIDFPKQFDVEKHTSYEAMKRAVEGLYEAGFAYSKLDERTGKVGHYKSRWVDKIGYIDDLGCVELVFASDVIPLITRLEARYTEYELKQGTDFSIKEINQFYEIYDKIALNHKNDAKIMLNRNSAYLNWRYLNKVGYKYYCFEIVDSTNILVGFFILKIYEDDQSKTLHIIDFILPKNKEVYQKILNYTVRFAMEQYINLITLIVNEKLDFFSFLKSNGFKSQERHFIPIVHKNNETVDIKKMDSIHDYYFTMGDNDIF